MKVRSIFTQALDRTREAVTMRGTVERLVNQEGDAAADGLAAEDRAIYHQARDVDEVWDLAHSRHASWWT